MEYLVYHSSALHTQRSEQAALAMMTSYAALMPKFRITGLLLYSRARGSVVHYIEGRSIDLTVACHAMDGDGFQHDLNVLVRGLVFDRHFPSWQMSFDATRPIAHPAYTPLLTDSAVPWPDALQDARELLLLRNFRTRAFAEAS